MEQATPGPAGTTDNQSAIMHCALDLFARRGYDGVGVLEIVTAAGVTKPTLYHYFDSKTGLLQAILQHWGEDLERRFGLAARYQGDVPLTLQTVALQLVAYAQSQPVFYRFLLSLHFAPVESEARQAGTAILARLQDILTASFADAAGQLGNMHGRQALFAASYFGVLNTWIGLELNGHVRLDEATVHSVVRQFMYGIHS